MQANFGKNVVLFKVDGSQMDFQKNAICVTVIPRNGISHRVAVLNDGFINECVQLVHGVLPFFIGVSPIKGLSSLDFLLLKDFLINLRFV